MTDYKEFFHFLSTGLVLYYKWKTDQSPQKREVTWGMQIEKKNPPIKLQRVRRKGLHKALARNGELLLMLLPRLTLLVIFRFLPMSNITIAFKDYNIFAGIARSEWVGFKHFET